MKSSSGMPFSDFLNAIIDDGQDEIRREYLRPDQSMKREGALAGFEACRGKTPPQLLSVQKDASQRARLAMLEQREDYWYWRCYEAQVEWVLNVFSAALHAKGDQPLVQPTYRGMRKAADILGVG